MEAQSTLFNKSYIDRSVRLNSLFMCGSTLYIPKFSIEHVGFVGQRNLAPEPPVFISPFYSMSGLDDSVLNRWGHGFSDGLTETYGIARFDTEDGKEVFDESAFAFAEDHMHRLSGLYAIQEPLPFDDVRKLIKTGTAAGFPHNSLSDDHPLFAKKKGDIALDDEKWGALVEFCKKVEECGSFAEMCEYVAIWTATSKSEILQMAKAHPHKIRLIISPPLWYLVLALRWCYRYNQSMTHTSVNAGCGLPCPYVLGHSPTDMVNAVKAGFPHLYSASSTDLSTFDATQKERITHAEFVDRKGRLPQTELANRMMDWLEYNETRSYILLPSGQLLRKRRGMCSGSVRTTYGNSWYRMFILAYSYYVLYAKKFGFEMACLLKSKDFEKDVVAWIQGDDQLLAVSPSAIAWFNRNAQSQVLAGIGQKVKNVGLPDSPGLVGGSFLSFEFVADGGALYGVRGVANSDRLRAGAALPVRGLKSASMTAERVSGLAVLAHVCDDPSLYAELDKMHASAVQAGANDSYFPSRSLLSLIWDTREGRAPGQWAWLGKLLVWVILLALVGYGTVSANNYQMAQTKVNGIPGGPGAMVYPTLKAGVPTLRDEPMAPDEFQDYEPPAITTRRSVDSVAHMTNVFDREGKELHLGEESKDWLITSSDPFHDTAVRIGRAPAADGGDSTAVCVKKTYTISAPTDSMGNPITKSWDAQVNICPVLETFSLTAGDIQKNAGTGGPSPEYNGVAYHREASMGNVTVTSAPTGQPMWPNVLGSAKDGTPALATLADFHSWHGISGTTVDPTTGIADSRVLDGRARLISVGFEVANVTPWVDKSGVCIVYRQPTQLEEGTTTNILTPGLWPVRTIYWRAPPSTASDAMILNGSRQWPAAEGCYVVGWANTPSEPATLAAPTLRCPIGDDFNPASTPLYTTQAFFHGATGTNTEFGHTYNTDQSGAYFVGLAPATKLQVNVRFYYELYPTPAEGFSVLVTQPTPQYDPRALQLHSMMRQASPPGVRLDENFTGGWFKNVMGSFKKMLPGVVRSVSHVLPPGVRELAEVGASLVDGKPTGDPMTDGLVTGGRALGGAISKAAKKRKAKRERKKELRKGRREELDRMLNRTRR